MSLVYRFDVVEPIADTAFCARVGDLLVWRYPDVFLQRRIGGRVHTYRYPPHFTFVILAYEDRLIPRPGSPRLPDLARQVAAELHRILHLRPNARPAGAPALYPV